MMAAMRLIDRILLSAAVVAGFACATGLWMRPQAGRYVFGSNPAEIMVIDTATGTVYRNLDHTQWLETHPQTGKSELRSITQQR